VRLAQLIGLNAVPGFGFFALHWTAGTLLTVYWFENLLGSLLIALRIGLHRRLTHKRGHYVTRQATTVIVTTGSGKSAQTKRIGTILGSFLLVAIPFTVAEGVFLLFILGRLPESDAVDFNALRAGVRLIAALLAGGL